MTRSNVAVELDQGPAPTSGKAFNTPEGAVTWGDPMTYTIETDYKIDARASGRYPAWRFEGEDAGNFQLSGIDFSVILDGER